MSVLTIVSHDEKIHQPEQILRRVKSHDPTGQANVWPVDLSPQTAPRAATHIVCVPAYPIVMVGERATLPSPDRATSWTVLVSGALTACVQPQSRRTGRLL